MMKFNPTKPLRLDFLKGGKEGVDTFEAMAKKGLWIIDRVVQEELKGGVDLSSNSWYIPKK